MHDRDSEVAVREGKASATVLLLPAVIQVRKLKGRFKRKHM